MLHHVSIGVASVERAALFYDPVLKTLGYKRIMEFMPYGIGYGLTGPQFWVQVPNDQQAATNGNGTHIAFNAKGKSAVHAFHAAALAAGGKDEGAPGPRPDYSPHYYGAFVRDLDGNKLEAVFYAVPAAAGKSKSKTKPAKKASARKSAARKSAKARKPAKKKARKAKRR